MASRMVPNRHNHFSLVEFLVKLLIVVVIICLIAAFSVPRLAL